MNIQKAKLSLDDNRCAEFPIYSPTSGNDVIDIKNLGGEGIYTLDEGFYSTAACRSKITFIDGEKGILHYRGYPIDQLADRCDYMEVCYLLMYGELPTQEQKEELTKAIKEQSDVLPKDIGQFFKSFHRDAHPMAMMLSAVGVLSAFYHHEIDINTADNRKLSAIRLIAQMPLLAAMSYRHSIGEAPIKPSYEAMSYAENFLHLLFGSKNKHTKLDPILIRAMDRIFTLHADHEQNASTTAVRVVGSTGSDPFACISAGIAALWGPAHGGANEACLNMLKEIGDTTHISKYIEKAKDKDDPFRLMGFGHRVYKNYDPRAKVMRETCHQVLDAIGKHNEPLFKLALELEKIALEDDYFVQKKLYPNVDFYSGLTLDAIGIPSNMFTVIFALSRTVGWISHWMEMMNMPHRLARPRQLYLGENKRSVVPIDQRK